MLFLAWHYAIQETATQTARKQVHLWMQELGATAATVQFRMLRGSLTINNIKASYLGGDIHIQQLFIKGNLASINAEKPLLHHIQLTQFTYNAAAPSESWKNIVFKPHPSLLRIFQHAKHIKLQQGVIHNLGKLPPLNIDRIDLSGTSAVKSINANGNLGQASNSWSLNNTLHLKTGEQTGQLTALFDDIQSTAIWSGSWHKQTLQANIQQTQSSTQAALTLNITQQAQQWQAHIDAVSWPIQRTNLQTEVTGQGLFTGDLKQWQFKSEQLAWAKTMFRQPSLQVSHILAHNIQLDSVRKLLQIEHLTLNQGKLTLKEAQTSIPELGWKIKLKKVDILALETTLILHQQIIRTPPLDGWLIMDKNKLHFDLANQDKEKQHWHLRKKGSHIEAKASHIPLLQLRSMLPEPIRHSAFVLQGDTSFELLIEPQHHWSTTGKVEVSSIIITSKDKNFQAESLNLNIQHADTTGVQQASLSAQNWLMHFPLTPRQAWSTTSHLDEWANIPWQLQAINLRNGQISIGNIHQTWLTEANLNITNWQDTKPAKLQFDASFGLAALHTKMTLTSSKSAPHMQWQTLNLQFKYANMQALSEWLDISNFPSIKEGQLSLAIKASKEGEYIVGSSNITFNHLQYLGKPLQHDFFLQHTQQTTQQVAQQLTKKNKIHYVLPLQGPYSDGLSNILAQAFFHETQARLRTSKTNLNSNHTKHVLLGSIRLHSKRAFSHNERTRLRNMIKAVPRKQSWHLNLVPDLGTAQLTAATKADIFHTQSLIKAFLIQRGIKAQNIFLITAQAEDRSTNSTGAIHITLVK